MERSRTTPRPRPQTPPLARSPLESRGQSGDGEDSIPREKPAKTARPAGPVRPCQVCDLLRRPGQGVRGGWRRWFVGAAVHGSRRVPPRPRAPPALPRRGGHARALRAKLVLDLWFLLTGAVSRIAARSHGSSGSGSGSLIRYARVVLVATYQVHEKALLGMLQKERKKEKKNS
ncbi:hypothetical protein PVAP13_9KG093623 [Panicum virgatum]|uniref:Uncharacterized protein n=1 Tax=Panicum virgatum TaxID=38727 RepID=A0A8T0NSH5_PANVG|nr:hypothetical protein PVAP13_9KG093623 [Panicum virgatum]